MVTRAVQQLSFNPLDPPLMGEEEIEDLRDSLKLPVRLRRTLSFVIPAEAGIQFWGLPSTPSWIAGLRDTLNPSPRTDPRTLFRQAQVMASGRDEMISPPLLAAAHVDVGLPDLLGRIIIVVVHKVEVARAVQRWLPGQR